MRTVFRSGGLLVLGLLSLALVFFVATAQAASTPVLFWGFDEGSGSTVDDTVGDNDATLFNSPSWLSGGGLTFNGTNQYVRSTNAVANSLGRVNQPYTIAAQVRVAPGETDGTVIHVSDGSDGIGWCIPMLDVVGGKFRALSWINNGGIGEPVSVVAPTSYTTGEWYDIAAVWDDSADLLKLYVDGSFVASAAMSNFFAAGTDVYVFTGFGTEPCASSTGYFKGDVRDVHVNGAAMTAGEIDALSGPILESKSPEDDDVDIAVSKNLMLTFDRNVTVGTGDILIKKTSDDTTVETIDVTSDQVTGGGSDTITINPDSSLDNEIEYYIIVPNTAFKDGNNNFYEGISSFTEWSFTTIATYTTEFALAGIEAATSSVGVALPITDLRVVGNAASSTPVKLLVTNGSLALGTTDGLTFTGDESGDTLQFSGTIANINAALATLTYTRNSLGTDTLEVSLVEPGEVFFPENNHIYTVINSSVTANTARTQAKTYTKYGSQGYLATITSAAENTYVNNRLSSGGWIGGSDAASEGVWRWLDGPEAGQQFWSGGTDGSVTNDLYANWNDGEPNNSGSNEDCVQFVAGGSGFWNDLPCNSSTLPYVVEFGDGDELVASKNIALATVNAPTVTVLTPSDSAEDVAVDVDLRIEFSQAVSTSTGNILIKKTTDDTTVATIDIADSAVSRASSTAFTISLPAELDEQTGYYVTLPATAIKNTSGIFFAGITATSTWNFTTGDFTAPAIDDVDAPTRATTTAAIAWITDEVASTKVVYGLSTSYGSSTTEIDLSPRVTSHEVTLSNLSACTLYHYAVVSTDTADNTATSSDATFVTAGCDAGATPVTSTSNSVTTTSGGSTSLTEDGDTLTVEAPANFTATSSSVVVQIKSIVSTGVYAAIGKPTAKPRSVGNYVFDIRALINNETLLESFDAPVTIRYQYEDADTVDIEEDSLWVYHYHDGVWTALDDCAVNIVSNIVTCSTDSFSLFGLFGNETTSGSQSTRTGYRRVATPDTPLSDVSSQTTLRTLYETNQITAAVSLIISTPSLALSEPELVIKLLQTFITKLQGKSENSPLVTSAASATTNISNRDLYHGLYGEDVTTLQNFLIGKSYTIPAGPTGFFGRQTVSALTNFQKDNNISPSEGYFGAVTRSFIQSRLAGE